MSDIEIEPDYEIEPDFEIEDSLEEVIQGPIPKGDKGDKGDTGDKGGKGDKGDKGDTGEIGIQGLDGKNGKDGISLDFKWDGTKLGVKRVSDKSFEFRELAAPAEKRNWLGGSSSRLRISSVGTGQSIIQNVGNNAATLKSLIAGTGITITSSSDALTITGPDTSGFVPYIGATTDVNLGANALSCIAFSADSSGFRTITPGGMVLFADVYGQVGFGDVDGILNNTNFYLDDNSSAILFSYFGTNTTIFSPTLVESFTDVRAQHYLGNTDRPAASLSTGAGTGATSSLTGNDFAHFFSVTTGTTPAAGAIIATVTFAKDYGTTPRVVFSEANAQAVGSGVYMVATGADTYIITSTTALTASRQYSWNIICGA